MAFAEGVAQPDTGSHKPAKIGTSTGKSGQPIPKMAHNSVDGVVTKPKRETHQGWYPNQNVREVES